jgi:hypothetical protein
VALTDEQLELWRSLGGPRTPESSGDQTPEQARNFYAWSFQQVCAFEGIDVPSEEDVLEELDGLTAPPR